MKRIILITVIVISSLTHVNSQNMFEGFEGLDSLSLPAGWSVYNNASFPIPDFTNWTVRSPGASLPGLSTSLSVVRTGNKAIGIIWWTSQDTNGVATPISDAWLVTKKIHVWTSSAIF